MKGHESKLLSCKTVQLLRCKISSHFGSVDEIMLCKHSNEPPLILNSTFLLSSLFYRKLKIKWVILSSGEITGSEE